VNNEKNHHLSEDQIIRAVVDESELSLPVRQHLGHCNQCRAQKARLEQNLVRLGQLAGQFVPVPHQRLSLQASETLPSLRWSWNWKTALGTALATAALFVFVWWASQGEEIFETYGTENVIVQDLTTSESLMTEVSILSENALPQEYMDIAAETGSEINEEFINFMAPLIEDDSLTFISGKKGVWLC
jgi:hypothetical protein